MVESTTLQFQQGRSNKFWTIRRSGKCNLIIFGRIGAAGQTQTKKYATPAEAQAAYRDMIARKIAKGYAAEQPIDHLEPAVPRLTLVRLKRVTRPITAPVTKFGGQPAWIDGPQWPISRAWKLPMRFIGQVALDPRYFGRMRAKMAYLFARQFEWPINGDYFDELVCFAGRGENAVILQPGGDKPDVKVDRYLEEGPTLYDHKGVPCEFAAELKPAKDPIFIAQSSNVLAEKEERRYFDTIYGDKVGGTPAFFQGDEWPKGGPEKWKLLLQFDSRDRKEFFINIPSLLFAFVSNDGKQGRMLAQH